MLRLESLPRAARRRPRPPWRALLAGAALALLTALPGQAAPDAVDVRSAAFSPDGRLLVSGWSDGQVRLTDLPSGKPRATLAAGDGWVSVLAFSRDSRLLATAADSDDGTVRVWEARTGTLLYTLPGEGQTIRRLAFSPDGALLAGARARLVTPPGSRSSHAITEVRLWNMATGRSVATQPRADAPLLFTPDGRTLIAGVDSSTPEQQGENGPLVLLDLVNLGERKVLPTRVILPEELALAADGSFLVAAGEQQTLQIWDPRTGERLRTLAGADCSPLALSPDGNVLVTGAAAAGGGERLQDGLLLWNPRTGRQLAVLEGAHANLVFSGDGRVLLTAGDGPTVDVWEARTGRRRTTLRFRRDGDMDVVDTLALSPDGRLAATGGSTGRLRLWDTQTGKLLAAPDVTPGEIRFSPDGTLLAAEDYPSLLLFDVRRADRPVRLGLAAAAAGAPGAANRPPGAPARDRPARRSPAARLPDRRGAARSPARPNGDERPRPPADRFVFY